MNVNNIEQWRTISGYVNYGVSNHGRVMNLKTNRIVKPGVGKSGYKQLGLYVGGERSFFLLHRLVAQEFIPNPDNKQIVDHIDGNRLNNCIDNLRWATSSENSMNISKKDIYTSSIYKGVCKNKKSWQASIKLDGKKIHIGIYKTEAEAAKAYNEKALELFGEFANLNDVE